MIKSKTLPLAALIGSLSIIPFNSSFATGIPTADAPNLIEKVIGNIQEATSWVEESGLMTMAMEMESYYSQAMMGMDSFLAQTGLQKGLKFDEDLHNLMVKEQAEPDDQIVENCAISEASKDTECIAGDNAVKRADQMMQTTANFGATPVQAIQKKMALHKNLLDTCRSLQYAENDPDLDELSTSLCLRPGLILGTESNATLTPQEAAATRAMVDLIAGPAPSSKASQSMSEGSPRYLQMVNKEMRRQAVYMMAYSSLEHVASQRRSPAHGSSAAMPSPLSLLEKFDDKRLGDPAWLAKIGFATSDIEKADMPSEVMRKMAAMQAIALHLDVLMYKQNLRMEALSSTKLAIDVNPL
ncbi:hypothetical protein AB6D11_02880 [Vibrio splendidus]